MVHRVQAGLYAKYYIETENKWDTINIPQLVRDGWGEDWKRDREREIESAYVKCEER